MRTDGSLLPTRGARPHSSLTQIQVPTGVCFLMTSAPPAFPTSVYPTIKCTYNTVSLTMPVVQTTECRLGFAPWKKKQANACARSTSVLHLHNYSNTRVANYVIPSCLCRTRRMYILPFFLLITCTTNSTSICKSKSIRYAKWQ